MIFIFIILLISIGFPSYCFADGLIPVIAFFSPMTMIPATIVLIAVITLETLFLKLFIKNISWIKHLQNSLIINIASSIVGSLIPLILKKETLFFWLTPFSIIPFGIITIFVEFPLIYLLYKKEITILKSFWLSVKLNAISYLLLFVLQIALFIGIGTFSYAIEEHRTKSWNHSEILTGDNGYIYSESDTHPAYLKRYSIKEKKWDYLDNYHIIETKWDITDHYYATAKPEKSGFMPDSGLYIYQILEHKLIGSLPRFNIHRIFKISPDGQYLAVLNYMNSLQIKILPNFYYTIGSKCKLMLISVNEPSDSIVFEEPLIDDGIDWSPDSKKIACVSLKDKQLFALKEESGIGTVTTDKPNYKPKKVVVFDIEKKIFKEYCDGTQPKWAHDGKSLYFINKNALYLYNSENGISDRIMKMPSNYEDYSVSPGGNNIVTNIRSQQPLSYHSYLTIINLKNPSMKYIIDPKNVYYYNWTN